MADRLIWTFAAFSVANWTRIRSAKMEAELVAAAREAVCGNWGRWTAAMLELSMHVKTRASPPEREEPAGALEISFGDRSRRRQ